MQIQLNSM